MIDGLYLEARFRTADDVRLSGVYLPGHLDVGPDRGSRSRAVSGSDPAAILLVHGFAASARKPAYAHLAARLSDVAPVLSVDLRGHGRSEGACTLGDREVLDVEAAVAWLMGTGHGPIVAVGVSMGAAAVLGAASNGAGFAAAVTISGPARWQELAPPGPLRRLEGVWHSPVRRAALWYGLRTRLAAPTAWSSPPDPVSSARRLAQPLLVLHGADDGYFPVGDAWALAGAAGSGGTLWMAPAGFGHGEDGFTSPEVGALPAAIAAVLDSGRFPCNP